MSPAQMAVTIKVGEALYDYTGNPEQRQLTFKKVIHAS